jgi:uncharacterized membrane protein
MNTIAVGEMLRFGWETFKKRPWFFIGTVVLVALVSSILSALAPDPVTNAFDFVLALAIIVLNIFIEMGLVAFALKVHDGVDGATFKHLWHPQSFWKYVGVKILTGLIVVVGLVLLIVPGIIAAIALIFATYLVVDRNLGPIEAIKESARLTKGHRWQLFLLALAIIGINILGAIALLVGLVVTIPVSLLAVVHAYRKLAGKGAAA